jgi:hypothetical protein
MDVMELVENETNARPFQCDWQTCNKVSNDVEFRLSGQLILCSRVSIENLTFKDIIASTQMRGRTHA